MNTTRQFPTGPAVLGRVLNSSGEAIDNKGALRGAQYTDLRTTLKAQTTSAESAKALFESGIKALDLLAPMPRGSVVGIYGGIGVGKLVVLEELLHNVVVRQRGRAVCLTLYEHGYETSPMYEVLQEGHFQEQSVLLCEPSSVGAEVRKVLLQASLVSAAELRAQGFEVLLAIDQTLADGPEVDIEALRTFAQANELLIVLLHELEEYTLLDKSRLDCTIVMSKELARRQLWPAVDRLRSTSQYLQSNLVSAEQRQVVEQVRQILQRAAVLEKKPQMELTEDEQRVLGRARRIEQFFTQPFHVAEAFTGVPGEYLYLTETIQSFKGLVEGRYDNLPEQAFNFVGKIEMVVAKSKNLSKG